MLILEGAQAGLSWSTILNKRDGYRATFAGFDPKRVARYGSRDFARLMRNEGIVRNRLKIEAVTRNARAFLDLQQEFGSFDAYIWRFVDGKPIQQSPAHAARSPALHRTVGRHEQGPQAARLHASSGMTLCYAFMQAVGMVNDHVVECFRHKPLARLGR